MRDEVTKFGSKYKTLTSHSDVDAFYDTHQQTKKLKTKTMRIPTTQYNIFKMLVMNNAKGRSYKRHHNVVRNINTLVKLILSM